MISNDNYNTKTDDIIVTAITSNILTKDYSILISNEDLREGDLKVNSCIRVDKIYTLSQNIVIKKFGVVNDNIINEVKEKINKLLWKSNRKDHWILIVPSGFFMPKFFDIS